jgi:hypothetical protein
MGLFARKPEPQKQKPPIDETSDGVQKFFDGYFADLRMRGRAQFEKTLEDNSEVFKKDLDAAVVRVNSELKEHVAQQLDAQIAESNQALKQSQDLALETLTNSAKTLQEQHRQLGQELQKSVADQQAALAGVFEDNKAQIAAMKAAQDAALQALNSSVQTLAQQQQELAQTFQKSVAAQQATIVAAFEENMAQIIEHYMLEAMGEQFDIKAQLPMIIKQMETNKQSMMDDIKL